ncbi:unnamed protein product [Rotaria sp. Silwood1]|nr:unnamed protein product [Rotaria sp. Silwood1]CAF0996048.1 unnamed protein product [Rotaria sp. Silwood1]CAF3395515.1 unnamed protein product [Rotaria sp. Silwood1]CAF3406622.1 unnamed protein product [Rotaria sp. Silwood1]CAF3412982.1 unnamed protein product [Rotaria sp. Silwood1]
MASSSRIPIKLSSDDKDKLANLIKELHEIKWEKGEYYFHNFIDYYQLPQIIRVEQTWNTDFVRNQWMYLQTLFDRYLIIASLLTKKSKTSTEKYLIPDWFQGECRILSKNPILKKRWWVFQGAFELYRFNFPRTIKILSHTPAHIKTTNNEWKIIVLCKNAYFNVIRREKYQSRIKNDTDAVLISEPKEAFIIQDPDNNDEFLIPPGVPLRFATLIGDHELHTEYQNHQGTFTFPEIMMRYEFPIDIEILTHLPIDLSDFKPQVRLEKFCVAKSVLAYMVDNEQMKIVELSPLTQVTIRCAKCLTYGLSQDENLKEEKFDEDEYQRYENIRSKMNVIFDSITEVYRSKIQLGSAEEIECIEKAYEISLKMRKDDEKPVHKTYFTLDEALKVIKEKVNSEISLPKIQPKRFTVHASVDPSNPYNEVIDYENMDALNKTIDESKSKTDDNKTKSSRDKSQQSRNRLNKRPALVVQQLPPPMLLPPETFEKTLKAIPDRLYTELLPPTKSKKLHTAKNQQSSS